VGLARQGCVAYRQPEETRNHTDHRDGRFVTLREVVQDCSAIVICGHTARRLGFGAADHRRLHNSRRLGRSWPRRTYRLLPATVFQLDPGYHPTAGRIQGISTKRLLHHLSGDSRDLFLCKTSIPTWVNHRLHLVPCPRLRRINPLPIPSPAKILANPASRVIRCSRCRDVLFRDMVLV